MISVEGNLPNNLITHFLLIRFSAVFVGIQSTNTLNMLRSLKQFGVVSLFAVTGYALFKKASYIAVQWPIRRP